MANIPGQYDTVTYQPRTIVAMPGAEIYIGGTLAPTTTELLAGTVLGVVTATNLYKAYANANTDGTEVAKVILAENVPICTVPQNVTLLVAGVLYKNMLVGLDAAAMVDLFAREVQDLIII